MEKCAISAFVNELNSNAVFQLSLASKELFHSNFLYWLAVSETKFFNKLLKNLEIKKPDSEQYFELDPSKHVVCREYNHFDFCICEKYTKNLSETLEVEEYCKEGNQPDNEKCEGAKCVEMEISDNSAGVGKVLLVLENKFKSIATKEQLDGYVDKIAQLNINAIKEQIKLRYRTKKKFHPSQICGLNREIVDRDKTLYSTTVEQYKKCINKDVKFILLSLSKYFPEVGITNSEWEILGYDKLSKALNKTIENDNNIDAFSKELIEKYHKFILAFSEYIDSQLIINNLTWSDMVRKELIELRVNDIWQKLIVSKFLSERLPDFVSNVGSQNMLDHSDSIYKGLYYGSAGASICIYVPFEYKGKRFLYHISLQSDQYRRGIIWKKGGEDEAKALLKMDYFLFDCVDNHVWSYESVGKDPYNSYKGTYSYFYKYRKIKKESSFVNIEKEIRGDVNNFIKWGKDKGLMVLVKKDNDKKIEGLVKQYGKESREVIAFLNSCSGNMNDFIELCEKWAYFDVRTQDIYRLATNLAFAYHHGIGDNITRFEKIERLQKAVKYYDIALENPMSTCKQGRALAYEKLQQLLTEK